MADKTVDGEANQDGSQESSNVVTREDFDKFKTEMLSRLDEERKASAGKDKKITELQSQVKEFQQASFSKDKLLEIQQKEFDDRVAEFEKQQSAIRAENDRERRENLVNKVIGKYSDKYPGLIRFANRIHGNNEEEIEIDIKAFVKDWGVDQTKRQNAEKVLPKPQTGSGKQQKSYAVEDFKENPAGKDTFANLPKEERERLFAESFDRE